MQESSHRKFSTNCSLCRVGVTLECGQRFCLYSLSYPKLQLAMDYGQWHTYKLAFVDPLTHTLTVLRNMWVPSFAFLCLDMYSQLFNMNKCCLKTNLKEKSTRSQWEALWESLVPYCSRRPDFKRAREGESETAVVERKKHEERKRLDIHRK